MIINIEQILFLVKRAKSVASILANGDIFVCPNVERRKELIQGNVQKDNFVEVWENKFEFSVQKQDVKVRNVKLVKIGNPVVEIVCIHGILRKRTFFLYKRLYGGYFLFKRASDGID